MGVPPVLFIVAPTYHKKMKETCTEHKIWTFTYTSHIDWITAAERLFIQHQAIQIRHNDRVDKTNKNSLFTVFLYNEITDHQILFSLKQT